jgi:hypothetical protein
MNRINPLYIFALVTLVTCLSLPGLVHAQKTKHPSPRIESSVDRSSLAIDEELELRVRVYGIYDRYIHPSFPDFELIGSYKKVRKKFVAGALREWREVHYRLRPRSLDSLRIGGAVLKLGGKIIATGDDLEIQVTNPPPSVSAPDARDLSTRLVQNMILHATSNKDSYWVGEPIVLSWDLISEEGIDVRPVSVERAPRLEGTSRRENLSFSTDLETVSLGGKTRSKRHYSRLLATKNHPGRLVVDSMRLIVRSEDGFGQARLVARSFHVPVKALPKGQPASFRPHHVGTFEVESRIQGLPDVKGRTVESGDMLFLEVQIKGEGNIRGLQPPRLDGTEHFDVRQVAPLQKETITRGTKSLSGTRQFRFELKARQAGRLTLPKVTFSFFDPTKEAYVERTQSHGTVQVHSVMETLYGGQVMDSATGQGLRLELGWPHVGASYALPVSAGLEMAPRLRLRFGHRLDTGTIGFEPGLEIRWSLARKGPWSVALYADPTLLMWFPDTSDDMHIGINLGIPGVLGSYQINARWSLALGLRLPLTIISGQETHVLLPVIADVGVDAKVFQQDFSVNVGAILSAGPEFCFGSCEEVGTHLRFSTTASLIW